MKLNKTVIGMVHLLPLIGTPKYKNNNSEIISLAIEEAKIYIEAGIDAIAIENMHDIPYLNKDIGPEVVSLMSIIAYEIRKMTKKPLGIQVLAGANKQALAIAKSANLDFVRAEGFIFSHVADEGFIDACAGEILRYRKQIEADNVLIFTDIKKKHSSHSITADVDIVETAKAAEFFMSNGVIVTGSSTGSQANINELKSLKGNTNLPVIIGSGITYENIDEYFEFADAFIVGSYFKDSGNWLNKVNSERVSKFMDKVKSLRNV